MTNNKTTQSNPFSFDAVQDTTASDSRRLDYTPALIDLSNKRASELMMQVSKKPELFELANKAIDNGEPQDLIDLIGAVYDNEQIKADSEVLDGCDDNQLSRLLESRRSDRSKSKKKNPRMNVQVCRTYIATMYAELLIREQTGKPYAGQSNGTVVNVELLKDDQEALRKKVNSLQSKKSRLSQIAKYDDAAKIILAEVEADIARLNALRPTVRTKTVVTDVSVDQLRSLLKNLPEAEQQELLKQLEDMRKLG